MKYATAFLVMLLHFSCAKETTTSAPAKTQNDTTVIADETMPAENAVKFLNEYVEFCNNGDENTDLAAWASSTGLTTEKFNTELKALIDEAYRQNPEMGLGADPLFDAQDYPDEGFELDSFDYQTNYVILKGIGWTDMKVALKMAKENNKWLVDGCGIVNIPEDKRMPR